MSKEGHATNAVNCIYFDGDKNAVHELGACVRCETEVRTGQVLLDAANKMDEQLEARLVATYLREAHEALGRLTGFPAPEDEDAFFPYQVAKMYLARYPKEN